MERGRRPEDIMVDVSTQLFWDNRINDSNINIEVSGSRVILTGTVPSSTDRWEAEEDAYSIPGVSYVENRLRVNPAAYPEPNDLEIRSRVENVLDWNPTIDTSRIEVQAHDGVVILKGFVDTYWQKTRAWEIASNVSGVREVINELKVKPPEEITDEDIENDIKRAFARTRYVDTDRVDVSVENGIVTLKGTVGDYYAYRTVQEIANYTSGVIEVHNRLVIE
ncbi:MAG TPA: BON domain-containing protein [Deltaproteobacteria bacterium]|nr:BON domain-containing protein [Deltaproteobacteria bacterium]HQJ09720.1 BON domain-containing protein [Deltaproteobacteria bacterium]